MRISQRWISAHVVLALLLSTQISVAWADRGGHGRGHYDGRHHHNRHYPALGVVVNIVPFGHHVVPYRGSQYYFHGGAWYRPHGPRFVVVSPPIGLAVSILPPYYTTLWVGGSPYYYADGVYYAWQPAQRNYLVVDPPRESEVLALPAESSQQFVYPKSGQNEQQQSKDRYDCHRWAVTQAGYDPTQLGGQTTAPDATRRNDYQRATKACLEGREYSVR